MNDILKQRLVGALILVALGVVFWPIIFVEPGEQLTADQAGIPPRPEVDITPMEPPDQLGLRSSPPMDLEQEQPPEPASGSRAAPDTAAANNTTPAAVPAKQVAPRTRSEPPERPEIGVDGLPVAWILQVASVSSAAKANDLRDRLLAMDQKAYVKKVERGERDLYRVYIGPKFEKAQLTNKQAQIDKEFGVKSMITRYVP